LSRVMKQAYPPKMRSKYYKVSASNIHIFQYHHFSDHQPRCSEIDVPPIHTYTYQATGQLRYPGGKNNPLLLFREANLIPLPMRQHPTRSRTNCNKCTSLLAREHTATGSDRPAIIPLVLDAPSLTPPGASG